MLLLLVFLAPFACGGNTDRFQDGSGEAHADLTGPGHRAVVNFSVPAECLVLNATVNVTGAAADGTYPMSPVVSLDDKTLWAFNGTGCGPLGRQELFSDGTARMSAVFGTGGGENATSIRLPAGAFVQNATVGLNASGPLAGFEQIFDATGEAARDLYGYSVSNAGDVNGDGYDDVLVGARQDKPNDDGGKAYLYLGGAAMDNSPDLRFTGYKQYGYLGDSVSAAGDVNGDGYDDFIIGASGEGDSSQGKAYVYFGGPAPDNVPDVVVTGEGSEDGFGISVSNAGDVNKDGYDDVIVGAPWNDANARDTGRAYIYFGGPAMDSSPDVTLTGEGYSDEFGMGVSTAGDVNGDGYDDVIVGARCDNGYRPGYAHIFFGGPAMDNSPDVVLRGKIDGDWFGAEVSDAGDLNKDGYGDVIVSAPDGGKGHDYIYFGGPGLSDNPDVTLDDTYWSASQAGDLNGDGYTDVVAGGYWTNGSSQEHCVNIYFGGKSMDGVPDMTIRGTAIYDLGSSVSGAGDVNRDGRLEIAVGASEEGTAGLNAGRAFIFSPKNGILNASLNIGSSLIWTKNGTSPSYLTTRDFSGELNRYLRTASPSGTDEWGNSYVDVPVDVAAEGEGTIGLFDLNVTYRWTAAIADFAGVLNGYISAHKSEKDINGNLTIPLAARALGAGKLEFSALDITYDGPPSLVEPIPDLEMDEDTINSTLLDLRRYFQDDFDPPSSLVFTIEGATNSTIVRMGIFGGRYLSADALSGPENDNWTGVVGLRIRCADTHGFFCISNPFELVMVNVNDPPVITSLPPLGATIGFEYVYQVTADDGDRDPLTFSLAECPRNMTISPGGKISWQPSLNGNYDVSVAVSDGQATAFQNYSIGVTGDNPPRFTTLPITIATVGVRYLYNTSAKDDDHDILAFSLVEGPEGMTINSATGAISWTPALSDVGNHTVTVRAYDGRGGADLQTFTLTVVEPPSPSAVAPRCLITFPANGTQMRGKFQVRGTGVPGSSPLTAIFARIDGGNWTAAAGSGNWTFDLDTSRMADGKHRIEARAFDGTLFSETASVEFNVRNPGPKVSVESPPWYLAGILVGAGTGLVIILMLRRPARNG